MTDETTYGLPPERLARLLAIGLENSAPPGDPEDAPTPAAFFQEMLATILTPHPDDPNSSLVVFDKPRQVSYIPSERPRTVHELLIGETTNLATFRTLRDSAKKLARGDDPREKQAAATAIYHAAIAGALVFQNVRITKHAYHEMRDAYRNLARKTWIPAELREMFREAIRMCRDLEATYR